MDVKRTIDINCDLGEGMSNDADLMAFISSCNIACGGHFGTRETIRSTVQLAKLHGVKVGAHPSYPDKENFGRKSMSISSSELAASLHGQISDFLSVCKEEGVNPNHIKLHGALYNDCSTNESLAEVIRGVYEGLNLNIPMYAPPNSALSSKIENTISEAFIDRRYNENGTLVSRAQPNALIEDSTQAWNQLVRMYVDQEVVSSNGEVIPMSAETFCLHGDANNARDIAEFIGTKLDSSNISLDRNG